MEFNSASREEKLGEMKTRLEEFDYVRFTVTDISGRPRTKIVPARNAYDFFESGIPFYSGMLGVPSNDDMVFPPGLESIAFCNVRMMADFHSFHPVPWVGENRSRTAEVMIEPGDYSEVARKIRSVCPRFLAREQIGKLEELGYVMKTGMEWEYYLVDKVTEEPIIQKWMDFHSPILHTEYEHWFTDVDKYLAKAGVNVQTMQNEWGLSQFEFTSAPAFGIQGVDDNVIMKQCIKEVAALKGWMANFMSKAFVGQSGSGAHFSFSVWDKTTGGNAFYDEAAPDKISTMARHWIAGTIKHAPALTALCCPTTNCYIRTREVFTPSHGDWGIENREALLRVKNNGIKGTYMENRLPGSLANPYLIMAGVIAAGLDGVKNELECPEPRSTGSELVGGHPRLPSNLEQALVCLEQDEVMREALGEPFLLWFTHLKREADVKSLDGLETESERFQVEKKRYSRTC